MCIDREATVARLSPDVPTSAIDLLEKLLKFNPRERITASEALEHEYFTLLYDPTEERQFDFTKFGIPDGDWPNASILDKYEENHQMKLNMTLVAHNIARSYEALALLPAEIWRMIFKFIGVRSAAAIIAKIRQF